MLRTRSSKKALAHRIGRTATIAVVLLAFTVLSGCYGRFPMTRAVYRINGDIGGRVDGDSTMKRFVRSIVMWVFIIIPVYGVAMFVDAIALNLVEFWTGEPIDISGIQKDGYEYAFRSDDGREAIMTISREGEIVGQTHFTRVSDSLMEVRGAQGNLTGRLTRGADGQIQALPI